MRFFNTAGPVNSKKHYCLPPLERLDLEEIMMLFEQERYFVLHAPRQTGKTSCLLSLMDYVNARGKYTCVYLNVEAAQGAREDVRRGIRVILNELGSRARLYLQDEFVETLWPEILEHSGEDSALNEVLTRWAGEHPKPLIVLIDEIDTLLGDTLISVLRQLRAGYDKRPERFPQSVILCGVRDVRDYRMHSSREKAIITGGSAFNIKAESLRLGDFTREDLERLYHQYTEETGQIFTNHALEIVWELTQGQPWLINALGYEVCFKMKEGQDRSREITTEMMRQAAENMILRKDTHIDQLADKLREDRVRRVIGPMLAGIDMKDAREDDIQYVLDLGLVRKTARGIQIANPLYREVIPRYLTVIAQYNLESLIHPFWYIREEDGRLDLNRLLGAFQEFFRENSEHWLERFQYQEAGPQLLLQAFLQRIVNSGGRVEREYGLGRERTDLIVHWKYSQGVQKVVLELKIRYGSLQQTIEKGLQQIVSYMDKCGTDEGHLIIFDRHPSRTWEEKIFTRNEEFQGKEIRIWGM
jgi:hypothetical protein